MSTETKLNPKVNTVGSSRVGTYICNRADLVKALGKPHETNGDKTTAEWFFETPAGPASLYDYWWNGPVEWSIGGHSDEVVEHMVAFLDKATGQV